MPEPVLTSSTEDDNIPPRPWWVRAIQIIIGLVALGGIIYISGIHQYFSLRRTAPSIEQPTITSKVQAPALTVPVNVQVLVGTTGSSRTDEDIERLVTNANRIWAQANITFTIADITYHEVSQDDLITFGQQPHTFIVNHPSYDPNRANLFLTQTLSGVNGLAYGGTSAVSVADYTSNLDFRTLAHEFGHLLGLPHVNNQQQLMHTGASGVELTIEEINTAREQAEQFQATTDE